METKAINKRLVLGVLVLVLGALLLMDNLNMIYAPLSSYIFSWKTLFILVGIYLLLEKQKLIPGLLFLGLGVTFWLPVIFNYRITLNQIFLPALLLIAGAVLLLRSRLAAGEPEKQSLKKGVNKVKDADVIDTPVSGD